MHLYSSARLHQRVSIKLIVDLPYARLTHLNKAADSQSVSGESARLAIRTSIYGPAKDTEDEVEHEEGANDDKRNIIDPRKRAAERVIRLQLDIFIIIIIISSSSSIITKL